MQYMDKEPLKFALVYCFVRLVFNPSLAVIIIIIVDTPAAGYIYKSPFHTPAHEKKKKKKIIKNKICDIQQIYLYQNACACLQC